MNEKSPKLNNYLINAIGISRKGLNIMCFIGVFIFGWLLAVAFDMLGKKRQGWFYVVPIIICFVLSRQVAPALALVGLILYIIGWVHANKVLSTYQSSARDRIKWIDGLDKDQITTDIILEKGLIHSKVLADKKAATAIFANALQMPGGDDQLLNAAGVFMLQNKHYEEAKQFFERAFSSTSIDTRKKQIKNLLTYIEKKLK